MSTQDTIAAIATPPGRGGVGVIRVSGAQAKQICLSITGKEVKPGTYNYTAFNSSGGELIDKGLVLFFKAPHSYTGEDVVEFQTHGSDVILNILLENIFAFGARPARAGEFTERAYINNKIDLVQAEAVADLIDSKSRKAARSAMRSLEGEFSKTIRAIQGCLLSAKALLEATLDFPDEEDIKVDITPATEDIRQAIKMTKELLKNAEAGAALSKGAHVVIIGKPNVGKSSLLNTLTGNDTAIVTDIPGTTRDMLKQNILLEGMELTLVDTAGIRDSDDKVEQEGVKRAISSLKKADLVLHVFDNDTDSNVMDEYIPNGINKLSIRNKIDIVPVVTKGFEQDVISISINTGEGISVLVNKLKEKLGLNIDDEHAVSARQRHLNALGSALQFMEQGLGGIEQDLGQEVTGELLRQALGCFDEVVGRISADDVLGAIFSQFCIGK